MFVIMGFWLGIMVVVAMITKQRVKLSEWMVSLVLWGFTLAISGAVEFDWWPDLKPLGWLTTLFEPPTRWVMGKV